jgi:hypothetical protein
MGVTIVPPRRGAKFPHVEPTRAQVAGEGEAERSPDEVTILSLIHCRFSSVGALIPRCDMLRVLDLSSNFIKDITPLVGCIRLVKLDLHNNHIKHLPGGDFWKRLRYLRVLHLHGNSIGGKQSMQASVQSLASCTRLQILTLHDTPLSLVRGYRHHVVNLIWSLIALDKHVIADSEIIEGASFPGRFAPGSEQMKIGLHWRCETDLWKELARIFMFLFEVRRIQAKHSPIQTIQRFWRTCRDWKRQRAAPEPNALGRLMQHSTAILANQYEMESEERPATVREDGTERTGDWFQDDGSEGENFSEDEDDATTAAVAAVNGEQQLPASTSPAPPGTPAHAVGALQAPQTPAGGGGGSRAGSGREMSENDEIFSVDRLKLLTSLQRTLQEKGAHAHSAAIEWSAQLPAES